MVIIIVNAIAYIPLITSIIHINISISLSPPLIINKPPTHQLHPHNLRTLPILTRQYPNLLNRRLLIQTQLIL